MRVRDGIAVLAGAAVLAACGEFTGKDGDAAAPWQGGWFTVSAGPSAQPCGDAMLTFTAPAVLFLVTSEGQGVVAFWDGADALDPWSGVIAGGGLDGHHFEISWPYSLADDGCVTTEANDWIGDASDGTFESVLTQTISDDCGVTGPCTIAWSIHGEAPP